MAKKTSFESVTRLLAAQLRQAKSAYVLNQLFVRQISSALLVARIHKGVEALKNDLTSFVLSGNPAGSFVAGALAAHSDPSIPSVKIVEILRRAIAEVLGIDGDLPGWKWGDDQATVLKIQGPPRMVQNFTATDERWLYYGEHSIVKLQHGKVFGFNNVKKDGFPLRVAV